MLINVIIAKVEYAGDVREGKAKLMKRLETFRMTASRNV